MMLSSFTRKDGSFFAGSGPNGGACIDARGIREDHRGIARMPQTGKCFREKEKENAGL